MKNSSLNLSGKIDAKTTDLLSAINQVTSELGISYLVVGATARDLVLHYGYGVRVQRATADIDFGVQVGSWEIFADLKDRLMESGFKETRSIQRMSSPSGIPVDIVPFGSIKNDSSTIQWPPEGHIEMNVLGFEEAHSHAMQVIIQEKPLVQVPVATPQGLTLLKLIAWNDRQRELRSKDALDLVYIFEAYQCVPSVSERVFELEGLMDQYDWSIDEASVHILGLDTAAITQQETRDQVMGILKNNLGSEGPNLLVEEMCLRMEDAYGQKYKLLKAFSNGFSS